LENIPQLLQKALHDATRYMVKRPREPFLDGLAAKGQPLDELAQRHCMHAHMYQE